MPASHRADQCKTVMSMYTQAFKVLEILEKSDKSVETSELAESLSLSRSAVWKHINELRQLVYDITSSGDEGYILHYKNQDFRPHIIYKHLKTKFIGRRMRFFEYSLDHLGIGKDSCRAGRDR